MTSFVDLQVHTTFSDGLETPEEIVRLAYSSGMRMVSVTDHDTIEGTKPALREGGRLGIQVVPGVEISTVYRGFPIHILGYGIDTGNEQLAELLDSILDYRKQHFLSHVEEVNESLSRAGKKQINPEKYERSQGKYFSKPGLALHIVSLGGAGNQSDAFEYLTFPDPAPAHVQPKHAISAIRASGGQAVISHPFAPKLSLKNIFSETARQDEAIRELAGDGLAGIEAYQSGHAPDDVARCLALARDLGLFTTCGTDWHGSSERKGEGIRKYIPFYPRHFGDLDVPEAAAESIIAYFKTHFIK